MSGRRTIGGERHCSAGKITSALLATLVALAVHAYGETIYIDGGRFGAGTTISGDTGSAAEYTTDPKFWQQKQTAGSIVNETLVITAGNHRKRFVKQIDLGGVTGNGWTFQFEITNYVAGGLQHLKLWIGTEAGDNQAGDDLIGIGAHDAGPPNVAIVDAGGWTQVSSSGSATRMGQFFRVDVTGVGWLLDFDLGGSGSLVALRLWAGTLAASPVGNAINVGSDVAPADSLVDASGWTELVNVGPIAGEAGHRSYPLAGDLGNYNAMVIKVKGNGGTTGTSYDTFEFVPPPPAGLMILVR